MKNYRLNAYSIVFYLLLQEILSYKLLPFSIVLHINVPGLVMLLFVILT